MTDLAYVCATKAAIGPYVPADGLAGQVSCGGPFKTRGGTEFEMDQTTGNSAPRRGPGRQSAELLNMIDQYDGNSINKALRRECMRELYLLAGSLNFYNGAKTDKIKSMIEFNKYMRDSGKSLYWLENGFSNLSYMVSCLHPRVHNKTPGITPCWSPQPSQTPTWQNHRFLRGCFARVGKWLFT